MPTIADHRAAFLTKMRRYVKGDDRERYEAVLDDLIQWSARQPGLEFFDNNNEQGVISFRRKGAGPVFWAAYARASDGAKLELLPRSGDAITAESREMAREVLQSFTREELENETTLRIPFQALKGPATRTRVKELMGKLLVKDEATVA